MYVVGLFDNLIVTHAFHFVLVDHHSVVHYDRFTPLWLLIVEGAISTKPYGGMDSFWKLELNHNQFHDEVLVPVLHFVFVDHGVSSTDAIFVQLID